MFTRLIRARRLTTVSSAISTTPLINLPALRVARKDDIANLVEVIQRNKFISTIQLGVNTINVSDVNAKYTSSGISKEVLLDVITAGITTFLLHVEARIASSLGVGMSVNYICAYNAFYCTY